MVKLVIDFDGTGANGARYELFEKGFSLFDENSNEYQIRPNDYIDTQNTVWVYIDGCDNKKVGGHKYIPGKFSGLFNTAFPNLEIAGKKIIKSFSAEKIIDLVELEKQFGNALIKMIVPKNINDRSKVEVDEITYGTYSRGGPTAMLVSKRMAYHQYTKNIPVNLFLDQPVAGNLAAYKNSLTDQILNFDFNQYPKNINCVQGLLGAYHANKTSSFHKQVWPNFPDNISVDLFFIPRNNHNDASTVKIQTLHYYAFLEARGLLTTKPGDNTFKPHIINLYNAYGPYMNYPFHNKQQEIFAKNKFSDIEGLYRDPYYLEWLKQKFLQLKIDKTTLTKLEEICDSKQKMSDAKLLVVQRLINYSKIVKDGAVLAKKNSIDKLDDQQLVVLRQQVNLFLSAVLTKLINYYFPNQDNVLHNNKNEFIKTVLELEKELFSKLELENIYFNVEHKYYFYLQHHMKDILKHAEKQSEKNSLIKSNSLNEETFSFFKDVDFKVEVSEENGKEEILDNSSIEMRRPRILEKQPSI